MHDEIAVDEQYELIVHEITDAAGEMQKEVIERKDQLAKLITVTRWKIGQIINGFKDKVDIDTVVNLASIHANDSEILGNSPQSRYRILRHCVVFNDKYPDWNTFERRFSDHSWTRIRKELLTEHPAEPTIGYNATVEAGKLIRKYGEKIKEIVQEILNMI